MKTFPFSPPAPWLCRAAGLLLMLLLARLAQAQSGPPGSGGPAPQGPTEIPLDGGASLLLAAGLGLGLRRLRRKVPPAA